jgi:hypothetical protein
LGKINGSNQFVPVVLLHPVTDCADFNVRIRVGQEATKKDWIKILKHDGNFITILPRCPVGG